MSFLAPQFLWLLLALPLVVALHFVRSRRKRVDVSALFLWRQAAQLAERRRRFSPHLAARDATPVREFGGSSLGAA